MRNKENRSKRPRYDCKSSNIGIPGVPIVPNLTIAIVGGGLGGLACALALQQAGFCNVKVFERDSSFTDRRQGYGLTLTNNPKGPLAKLGLLQECVQSDCASECHWVFDPRGEIRGYYGRSFSSNSNASDVTSIAKDEKAEAPIGSNSSYDGDIVNRCSTYCESDGMSFRTEAISTGRGNLRVPRQELRRMLLERLAPGTVHWGQKLLGYSEDRDGITAMFAPANGSANTSEQTGTAPLAVRCDVLVGADGLHSVVRQLRDAEEFQLTSYPNHSTDTKTKSSISSGSISRLGVNGSECSDQGLPWLSSSISAGRAATAIEVAAIPLLSSPTPLEYLGVAVIIGLSTCQHPLVCRQGFYVLDGTHRLFTMPFREAASPKGTTPETTVVTESALHMWQLSFSGLNLEQAQQLRTMSSAELLQEAARRTQSWMSPVQALITQTPHALVWGTPLYDRAPMAQHNNSSGSQTEPTYSSRPAYGRAAAGGKAPLGSRVTLLGDAAHPMSMFKGQGCNQALEDGPLLAHWLAGGNQSRIRSSVSAPSGTAVQQGSEQKLEENNMQQQVLPRENLLRRLRCYERDMVNRSCIKQAASRAAARTLHSAAVVTDHAAETTALFGFEGVFDQYKHRKIDNNEAAKLGSGAETDALQVLHKALRERGVTAECGADLEQRVKQCIETLRARV
jgi:salicylate hydroxylase